MSNKYMEIQYIVIILPKEEMFFVNNKRMRTYFLIRAEGGIGRIIPQTEKLLIRNDAESYAPPMAVR